MTDDDYSLRLISALTDLWNAIRARHPEVPAVVLLPAPSPVRRMNVLGHFAPLRWKGKAKSDDHRLHEVIVVAEHLDRGAEDILDTLLHEAAHALNFEKRIKDCSKSQHHNAHFRAAAEALGLSVSRVPHYGWANTTLPPETAQLYEAELMALREVLISRRRPVFVASAPPPGGGSTDEDADGDTGTRDRHLRAHCACPHVIRLSKKTLKTTVIRCENCGEVFGVCPL